MMSLSHAKNATQAEAYHASEFKNAQENYYSEGDEIVGQWHGRLAEAFGLSGDVAVADFAKLANGQHPLTGDQLVKHQTSRKTAEGKGTMEHRAGWDATFSAPKSVSLTGLVGGDERVRAAHEASVDVALAELERYIQARIGGNARPEDTVNLVAAKFSHDSARPVNGYSAPQIHTHTFVFNVTQTRDGGFKPLQTRELYKSQRYVTNVYRSELDLRLQALGYRTERGDSGQPEIVGYTKAYLEAASPRRQQIEDRLRELGLSGPKAAQIAALTTRAPKLDLTREEVQRQHQEMAAKFGYQAQRVVAEAKSHGPAQRSGEGVTATSAVTYAKDRNFERDAVVDERAIMRDALARSMGDRTVSEVRTEFERRTGRGDFLEVEQRPGVPGRAYTTPEMQALERENIGRMQQGQGTASPLAAAHIRRDVEQGYPHLSPHQRDAIERILANTDRTQALEGVAGSGKTTVLGAVRDAAEREGYRVEGFAPTSRATQKLAESGIPSITIQKHLAQTEDQPGKRLAVLDESSLTSTVQMREFLARQRPGDRILFVGDVRQHESVDAGAPYQQLQNSGLAVTRLDEIIRQRNSPELKAVVEQLSRGDIRPAVAALEAQGRIHQIPHRGDRYQAIATEYLKQPEGTLVISPDNQSRVEINTVIHRASQRQGTVEAKEHSTRVLVPRQELTGTDRQWANRYERYDVVRYTQGSKHLGIKAGSYGVVTHINARDNIVIVRLNDATAGANRSYDPRRLSGVTLYREVERQFSVGDRVQFTTPDRALGVANRELGTIQAIDNGAIRITMDQGRTVTVPAGPRAHLDWGYAVTSHSSQGQTADRALFHVDTTLSAALLNQRTAYVAGSRPREDLQIFTDDRTQVATVLNRNVSQASAIAPEQAQRQGPALSVSA